MAATSEFSRANSTQDQLSANLESRLLIPGGPTTSDHFQVNVEPFFLQAHGLSSTDEIEIQIVSGPLNNRQYTQFKPAGGRDLVLSTRLNVIPIMYPGTYRLRRRTGAASATVYGFCATGSHDWSNFYANIGDEAAPVYAETAGFADNAEGLAWRDNFGGIVGGATTGIGGTVTITNQPLADQGGSSHLSFNDSVASDTAMRSLTTMAIDLLDTRKYRFEFIGYFTCASAGGLKVDMICSNASYMNYAVVITPTGAAQISDCNLASGTAVGGTGFTEALVRITGFVTMSADGPIIPRFSQQASNVTPTVALLGCDINVTERTRY